MDKAFALSLSSNGRDVVFKWQIAEGYYLYRDQISIRDGAGKELVLDLPEGSRKDDPAFGDTEVYFDRLQFSLANAAAATMQLSYQGCQDGGLCYPPKQVSLTGTDVNAAAGAPRPLQSNWQLAPVQPLAASDAALPDFRLATNEENSLLPGLLAQGGVAWVLIGFLGLGLLLAFTPCVLPIYPILAASLQRSGEALTARRGFVLSAAYVIALALAFALFGIIAAKLGQNLQFALQTTAVTVLLAVAFVLLALSSFGLFELRLPHFLTDRFNRTGASRRGSVPGAMLLGFSSALLIGPCVTAPLAGALLYIANQGNIALGAAALFALGLGKGVPLIVLSTFGSGLLPKAGAWMKQVQIMFGFLFLATALWQIGRLLPDEMLFAGWAVLLVTVGIFIGAFDQLTTGSGPRQRLGKSLGLLTVLYGILLAVGAASGANDPFKPLAQLQLAGNVGASASGVDKSSFQQADSKPQLQQLISDSQQKASLVYFTADWCVTCRNLESGALRDASVAAALDGLNLIKVDLSTMTPENRSLMETLQVVGPPTMVFVNRQNHEISQTRLVGEFDASDIKRSANISRTQALTSNLQEGSL